MLNCRETTELCSQELERKLGLGEKFGLHTHLMMCKGCSNFRRQMKTLREAMAAYAKGESASETAERRADDGASP